MFGKKYDTATTDEMPAALTAGCGRIATVEEVEHLAERFNGKPVTDSEEAHISGFLAGMQFLNAPADSEVYGMDALDFEENAYGWFVQESAKADVRMVIDILEGFLGDDDGE